MDGTERLLHLEGGSNFRDLGGYPAADGRKVRWGQIFRSGAFARLSERDWTVLRDMRIGAVCDLRSREERELAPTTWQGGEATTRLGPAYDAVRLVGHRMGERKSAGVGEMEDGFYAIFPELLAPSFADMFRALADDATPLVVHCTAGQDRTGLAIGLLLTALGVPRATILEDYALSEHCRRPENEIDRLGLAALEDTNIMARYFADAARARGGNPFKPRRLVNRRGEPLLFDAFAAIERRWESLDVYLEKEVGVTAAMIHAARENCLE